MRVKMSKQPPPAPTASAVGPCPTIIQIVGRPGTGCLPSTIAPPDQPRVLTKKMNTHNLNLTKKTKNNNFFSVISLVLRYPTYNRSQLMVKGFNSYLTLKEI